METQRRKHHPPNRLENITERPNHVQQYTKNAIYAYGEKYHIIPADHANTLNSRSETHIHLQTQN